MKNIFSLITAVAFAVPVAASATSEPSSSPAEHVSPFACNAFALSPEVRKRHFEELGPAVLKLKKSMRALPDGYEFEFPADNKTYQLLTEWAFQERLCCPFFEVDLRFDRENGPLWLRLTGRPGTKEFIKEEFELANSRQKHHATGHNSKVRTIAAASPYVSGRSTASRRMG